MRRCFGVVQACQRCGISVAGIGCATAPAAATCTPQRPWSHPKNGSRLFRSSALSLVNRMNSCGNVVEWGGRQGRAKRRGSAVGGSAVDGKVRTSARLIERPSG